MIFMSKPNQWDLPSGISMSKSGKYISGYNGVHLGTKDTLDEAIEVHDKAKSIHIRELADEYKSVLPTKTYEALLKW